jgi:hypothetical protein
MDEMSVRLDDGTDLGEDQKKNLGLGQHRINFLFYYYYYYYFCIDQDYLFFLLDIVHPD